MAPLRAAQLVHIPRDTASVSISLINVERGWFGPRGEQGAARLLWAMKCCLVRDVGVFRFWIPVLGRTLCSLGAEVLLGMGDKEVKQVTALFFPCTEEERRW